MNTRNCLPFFWQEQRNQTRCFCHGRSCCGHLASQYAFLTGESSILSPAAKASSPTLDQSTQFNQRPNAHVQIHRYHAVRQPPRVLQKVMHDQLAGWQIVLDARLSQKPVLHLWLLVDNGTPEEGRVLFLYFLLSVNCIQNETQQIHRRDMHDWDTSAQDCKTRCMYGRRKLGCKWFFHHVPLLKYALFVWGKKTSPLRACLTKEPTAISRLTSFHEVE